MKGGGGVDCVGFMTMIRCRMISASVIACRLMSVTDIPTVRLRHRLPLYVTAPVERNILMSLGNEVSFVVASIAEGPPFPNAHPTHLEKQRCIMISQGWRFTRRLTVIEMTWLTGLCRVSRTGYLGIIFQHVVGIPLISVILPRNAVVWLQR